ncbi:MAG: class I SAM-dependent methyltransferase [Oscillospiraceae bacterium]|nr:class I SAM-dependent methyltransferase [Oscillospiraceae bacterium]
METNEYLIGYYSNFDEDGRLTSRHGSVEFLTTMRYIERYLKPGDKVIEIGAGTGRYSHTLAQKGYTVDAVDLVEHNIEIFRQNTQPGEKITITQGNAMDLSVFLDNTYDITLLLGPLYHLYNQEDKRQAISEAIRVTKQGGIVFAAYVITDVCLLDESFSRNLFSIAEYIEKGLMNPETFATRSTPDEIIELVRKEDIDTLMSVFPVSRLHYVASDGYARCMREAVDSMDDATFELYLRYHLATCEREDMVGFTSHSLDIFRRKKL